MRVTVTLLNLNGQEVYSAIKRGDYFTIPTIELSTGVYLLQVESENAVETQKLTISNHR